MSDAEKFRRLVALARTKIKPLGRSSVEVAGVWMNVRVDNYGRVELRIRRKRFEDIRVILEKLRDVGYNAELRENSGRFEVYISQIEVVKHQELVAKVCEVLRRKFNEAVSEGRARRIKAIAGQ